MKKGIFFRSERLLLFAWAIIPFLIYSCSCGKSVENNSTLTESKTKEVKELEEKEKSSSTADVQRDTVIIRDSTSVRQNGDTVYYDSWHTKYVTKWRDRIIKDTLKIHLARDSTGTSTVEVQEVKETIKKNNDDWNVKDTLIFLALFAIGVFATIYYFKTKNS